MTGKVPSPAPVHVYILCMAVLLSLSRPALGEQLVLNTSITAFAPKALGGIRNIVRYAVARPDRSEIDYLLLGESSEETAGAPSVQIQVRGPHGDDAVLADVDGADCTLSRAGVFRTGGTVVLVTAVRVFDTGQMLSGGMSQAGPVEVQVYRRQQGGDAGESAPLFKADQPPIRTSPLCSASEMQRAMTVAASGPVNGDRGR